MRIQRKISSSENETILRKCWIPLVLFALFILGLYVWAEKKEERKNSSLSAEVVNVNGSSMDAVDEEGGSAVTFRPGGSATARLSDQKTKATKLRAKRDAVGKDLRQLAADYRLIIERAIESRPDLLVVFEKREDLDRELDQELKDPRIRDLAAWSIGERMKLAENLALNGITNPQDMASVKAYIESEVGKIRQFYFLHEMDRLLSDPGNRELADGWLRERIKLNELDQKFFSSKNGRNTMFNSFREFSDDVVPEEELLVDLLERPDRGERITNMVAENEMDLIDSSMPDGVEEQIGKLTKLGMNRAILEHQLRSQIPELEKLEIRRRELLVEHPKIAAEIRIIDSEIQKLQKLANR